MDVEDVALAPGAEDPLVSALAQTAYVVTALLSRLGAEHDLSLTQLRVLAILRDRGPVRVSALADHVGLEKSTMTGLVDRAARRGLLERSPSVHDGRAVDVLLTPSGQQLADRLYASFAETVSAPLGSLRPAEQRRLADLLRRVLDAAWSAEATSGG